jgi:hypothetical protein
MLGASSSDEDDDEFVDNDDNSEVLGVPKTTIHHLQSVASPHSESPAPSDSISQAISIKHSDSSFARRNQPGSFRVAGTPRKVILFSECLESSFFTEFAPL